MVYSYEECVSTADSIGLSSIASTICSYMQRESQFQPDVPCTCASDADANNPSNWIHGYQACLDAGLDPHCGLLQWSKAGFGSIYAASGCLGDLSCELQYAQAVSGGSCTKPWNPSEQCTPNYDPAFSGSGSGNSVTSANSTASAGCTCPHASIPLIGLCVGPGALPLPCQTNKDIIGAPSAIGGIATGWVKDLLGALEVPALLAVALGFVFIGIIAVTHQGGTTVNVAKKGAKGALLA